MELIVWVLFCFLASWYGSNRKIGAGWTFFWSLLLSPIIGFIIAAISGEKEK